MDGLKQAGLTAAIDPMENIDRRGGVKCYRYKISYICNTDFFENRHSETKLPTCLSETHWHNHIDRIAIIGLFHQSAAVWVG